MSMPEGEYSPQPQPERKGAAHAFANINLRYRHILAPADIAQMSEEDQDAMMIDYLGAPLIYLEEQSANAHLQELSRTTNEAISTGRVSLVSTPDVHTGIDEVGLSQDLKQIAPLDRPFLFLLDQSTETSLVHQGLLFLPTGMIFVAREEPINLLDGLVGGFSVMRDLVNNRTFDSQDAMMQRSTTA